MSPSDTTIRIASVPSFFLLFIISLPSNSSAQVRDTIMPGEEVRVMYKVDIGIGAAPVMVQFHGEMLQLDTSFVVIQLDNPFVLESEFVGWVEVRRCCELPKRAAKRRAFEGALLGIVAGAGATILGCEWQTINCRRDTGFEVRAAIFTLSRMALFGGIGALIGWKWPAKEWRAYPLVDVYVPPPARGPAQLRMGAGLGLR